MSKIYLVTGRNNLFKSDLYEVVNVRDSLDILDPLKNVGLDTETGGFSPFLRPLLMVQLGCRDFQVVIDVPTVPIHHYKEYLESDRLFIGWNLKFDLRFLFHNNIVPKNLYDGYLAEKMIWLGYPSGMHSLSLKSAGEHYCGVEMDKTVRGEIIWQTTLNDRIIEYAANDVKYLEEIMNKQKAILEERNQLIALDLENKCLLPTSYFEYCGVKLDINSWQKKMEEDAEKLKEAEDELNAFIISMYNDGVRGMEKYIKFVQPDLFGFEEPGPRCKINWNSNPQVISFLRSLGFNLWVKDKKTGLPKESVAAEVIEKQLDVHPIAPVYVKYGEAFKVVSTYGQNFIDLINPKTGRIHTSFNQIGTDTHRYSSGGGEDTEVKPGKKVQLVNMQNIPADERHRSCFVAEPGNVWISADYSGEESVILANISQDKAMIDLFKDKGDLHNLVAKMCFPNELEGIDVKDVKKLRPDLRKKAKSPEFTLAYGGTAHTMATKDKIPIEEAEAIERNYRKGFPGVDKYQAKQRKLVMQLGYIDTCPEIGFRTAIYDFDRLKEVQDKFGKEFWDRYRYLKENDPECETVQEVKRYFKRKSASERHSINYPIQGRGSAILKIALINLFNWVMKNNLFGIVKFVVSAHDEINLEVPEEIAGRVANALEWYMVDAGKFICKTVPLDVTVSRNDDGSLPTHWVH